jgi:hypothetical protein
MGWVSNAMPWRRYLRDNHPVPFLQDAKSFNLISLLNQITNAFKCAGNTHDRSLILFQILNFLFPEDTAVDISNTHTLSHSVCYNKQLQTADYFLRS